MGEKVKGYNAFMSKGLSLANVNEMLYMIKNVAVFCGSSQGKGDGYTEAACSLAEEFLKKEITLVNGAGNIGLMGIMAEYMLKRDGKVIGVIPHFLVEKEVCHTGLSQLHVVETMSERKNLIGQISDAFIALPGGLGTLDELFEVLTWQQLGLTKKPIGLLNVNGYFDHLLIMLAHMQKERFVREEHLTSLIVESSSEKLLQQLSVFHPKDFCGKWIEELKQKGSF